MVQKQRTKRPFWGIWIDVWTYLPDKSHLGPRRYKRSEPNSNSYSYLVNSKSPQEDIQSKMPVFKTSYINRDSTCHYHRNERFNLLPNLWYRLMRLNLAVHFIRVTGKTWRWYNSDVVKFIRTSISPWRIACCVHDLCIFVVMWNIGSLFALHTHAEGKQVGRGMNQESIAA